jgi:PP-loop superfamily ATP-utilizing enzyme
MIERGEALVRSLGFKVFRVRHLALEHETRARLQVAPDEMPRIQPLNDTLISALRSVGYDRVEIDPAGYRSTSG